MSENAEQGTSHQLTLFAEDSHVSLLVQPGSDEARQMTATSGRSLGALLQRSDPAGLWLKMCLDSERYISTRCYLTWKGWATPQRRPLCRLVPSTPRTDETGFGSWPTPTQSDGLGGPGHSGRDGGKNLRTVVAGSLNPTWVEWLMGFPLGWTDLERSETP
jgi:hypothetical protein